MSFLRLTIIPPSDSPRCPDKRLWNCFGNVAVWANEMNPNETFITSCDVYSCSPVLIQKHEIATSIVDVGTYIKSHFSCPLVFDENALCFDYG